MKNIFYKSSLSFLGLCITVIVVNAFFESVGLNSYMINVENISNININSCIGYILTILLSYITNMFLVAFTTKKISVKLSSLTLIVTLVYGILSTHINKALSDVILLLMLMFISIYLSDNKNVVKIMLNFSLAFILNIVTQFLSFQYKIKYFNIGNLDPIHVFILAFDYILFLIGICIFRMTRE